MKITIGRLKRLIKEHSGDAAERDSIASTFSDVYKEKYGIRPRFMRWEEMSTPEMQAALDKLYDEPADV